MKIDPGRILSVTQLQKLSVKKLRKKGSPLFVMDLKSKRKVFVILDMDTFENISGRERAEKISRADVQKTGSRADYRKLGLLWDRRDLANVAFQNILDDAKNRDHPWAVRRLLEYAPSFLVTKMLSLATLEDAIETIPLRPLFKEAWSHAIQYWSENP